MRAGHEPRQGLSTRPRYLRELRFRDRVLIWGCVYVGVLRVFRGSKHRWFRK
jgi:hypothetical protein